MVLRQIYQTEGLQMFTFTTFRKAMVSALIGGSVVAAFFIATSQILHLPRENLPSIGMMYFYVGYTSLLAFAHKFLYLAGASLGMRSYDLSTTGAQLVGGAGPFLFVLMVGGVYSPPSMIWTAWACILIGSTVSVFCLAYRVYVRKTTGRPLEYL